VRFAAGLDKLSQYLLLLKQLLCPFCGAAHTLNRHSKLFGNDPTSRQDRQVQRGQRVWCSDRGARGGCGRSFSIFLADVLPRHTVNASSLWSLLERLLGGGSPRSAIQSLKLSFAWGSLYHLLNRLRQHLPDIRSALCRKETAPPSSQTDPLLQTVEHLRRVFPQDPCPLARFQLHFGRAFLG